jgi:hypothetical protein
VGIVSFAAVTLVYIVAWLIAAKRVLLLDSAEDRNTAIQLHTAWLQKASVAFGVYSLYAFGLRFKHGVAVVTWLIESITWIIQLL